MSKLIILTLALCAFSAFANFKINNKNFADDAVAVVDTSKDANFTDLPVVTRYINGSYFALFGFNAAPKSNPASYSATRRLINSTTLKKVGDDQYLDLEILSENDLVIAHSTNGYVAVAGVAPNDQDAKENDLYIYIFSSAAQNGSGINSFRVTRNDDEDTDWFVHQLWFQDDYFYVVYTSRVQDVDKNVYIQGFKALDPNVTSFDLPLQINNISLSGDGSVKCAQVPGSGVAACVWRQETQDRVVGSVIDVVAGEIQDEGVIATDSDKKRFVPADLIAGDGYYVIILNQEQNGLTTKFSVRFSNQNNTGLLAFDLPNLFTNAQITDGCAYYEGWFLIQRSTKGLAGATLAAQEDIQKYNGTGDTNGTSVTLVQDGYILQGLTLPNQAYYVFIVDSLNGDYNTGYLARVFDSIDDTTFGSIIKTTVALALSFAAFVIVF